MPSFLRPSTQRCRDFMSHSNAYVTHLPTGYDLYFTVPFDLGSLHPMRPQELTALHDFLKEIQDEVAVHLGNSTLENVLQVQTIISRWLEDARCLGDLEKQAWTAGHGFPVYDDFQHLIDFHWDWDVMEFEGGYDFVSAYFNIVHPASANYDSHSMYRTPLRYTSPPPNTPVNRSRYGSANRDRTHSESDKPVIMSGAAFANINQVIQLEGDSHRGIRRIWGPNADSHFERVSRASWIDVETIEPTRIQQRNRQTKNEAKKHSPNPTHSWEDFYQRGLIFYAMAADTNTLVPYTDLYLLKLYKAMRDTGSSERDAMQTVTDVKWCDPMRSLPERPVWDDYSRWGEERPTYTFPNEPGYGTPQVAIQQAIPQPTPGDPAEEHYILPGTPMERVRNQGQGSERRFRIVQPTSRLESRQPNVTNQPEPQHEIYVHAPPAHHQSALVDGRDSLRASGRESERKAQIKAAKSLPESERKELNRIHSKTETRKALKNALAAHESKKAKERSIQNTAQQATRFQDHKQHTSSSPSAQEAITKREHTPKTVHQQALDPRRTINSVNPNAYRTRSFQEPTRLSYALE